MIDALDSVEDKSAAEEPAKPTLAQVLKEARDRPEGSSPSRAGDEGEPSTPSLSQLLREAAQRDETKGEKEEPSLLDVVGGAIGSVMAEAPAGTGACCPYYCLFSVHSYLCR